MKLPKLTREYIRAWCREWEIHPDIEAWFIETYAKSDDDAEILHLLNRAAAAKLTAMRNMPNMHRRKRIEWDTSE